ncbi:hypothetical protein BKA62DRAFT_829088 [Auriculariales sp. MPI-PUGE-AT-0066]|nr:hypothetical protein BKA62DRAFT_829088 [Auriculariales sp. MPI-PUGE-AT-0066]
MCEKPEEVMPRKTRFDRSKTCHKCKTTDGQLVVRHFVYCKECFLAHVRSKFKQRMPSPRTEDRDAELPLTVAFSGGMGSSVLLSEIARMFRRVNARRKIWKPITAVYVETCAASEDGVDQVDRIREIVQGYHDIGLVVVRLEDAFGSDEGQDLAQLSLADERLVDAPRISYESPREALRAYLAAQPTASARSTALSSLIHALVLRHSTPTGPIVFGTQLTALAVELIAGVAHGAGFSLASTHPRVFRPLQDLGAKECAAYIHWRGLRPIHARGPPSMESIGGLTREFITRLDRDYPSTVSAVARTCAKVVPRRDQTAFPCALCERPAQRGVLDWKSRTAIRSFEPMDAEAPVVGDVGPGRSTEDSGTASELCYACHTQLTSRARVRGEANAASVPVPRWTGTTLAERRAAMRSAVSEFILDDDDN